MTKAVSLMNHTVTHKGMLGTPVLNLPWLWALLTKFKDLLSSACMTVLTEELIQGKEL